MKIISKICLCSLAVVFATGCNTLPDKPKVAGIVRTTKKSLAKGEIELPFNYKQERAFRKFRLFSTFTKPIMREDSEVVERKAMHGLSEYLQGKMGYIKRFDVYAAHGTGWALASELEDIGDVQIRGQDLEPQGLDLVQTATIQLAKSYTNVKKGLVNIQYLVIVKVNITDANKRVVGRPLTYTGESFTRGFRGLDGRVSAGADQKQEDIAIQEACMHALRQYMGGIANEFPVTGKITSMTTTRMGMDKGLEQGLGEDNQVCIWARVGTLGVPLAYATAFPGGEESTLKIDRWNSRDPDAGPIIKSMQGNLNWLTQSGYELHATSVGMPNPPEWGGE